MKKTARGVGFLVFGCLLAATACHRGPNRALIYKPVNAAHYVQNCLTFMEKCLGETEQDANSECSWIAQATQVPECVEVALGDLIDCFNTTVTCGTVDQAATNAIDACMDTFDSQSKRCY